MSSFFLGVCSLKGLKKSFVLIKPLCTFFLAPPPFYPLLLKAIFSLFRIFLLGLISFTPSLFASSSFSSPSSFSYPWSLNLGTSLSDYRRIDAQDKVYNNIALGGLASLWFPPFYSLTPRISLLLDLSWRQPSWHTRSLAVEEKDMRGYLRTGLIYKTRVINPTFDVGVGGIRRHVSYRIGYPFIASSYVPSYKEWFASVFIQTGILFTFLETIFLEPYYRYLFVNMDERYRHVMGLELSYKVI
jgi:hypothetical protein